MKFDSFHRLRLDHLTERHRQILRLVRDAGKMSRTALHQKTGIRLRTIGELVGELSEAGYLTVAECAAGDSSAGRPQVPMQIDPDARNVVGIDLLRAAVEVSRINLLGKPACKAARRRHDDPNRLVTMGAEMAREMANDATAAIGVGLTGFSDPALGIHLGSGNPGNRTGVSLTALLSAVAPLPVVMDNEIHGIAARWSLTSRHDGKETLIVLLEDGRLAASFLLGNNPNRGCVVAANELGHTTMPVETIRCYCGQIGCLERIVSSAHLRRSRCSSSLQEYFQQPPQHWPQAVCQAVDLLGRGLSNCLNLLRPHRLVIVSSFAESTLFVNHVSAITRNRVLRVLEPRIAIEWHIPPAGGAAIAAGCLALRELYSTRQTTTDASPATQ